MEKDYSKLPFLSAKAESEWKRFFNKNKKRIEKMDTRIHEWHNEISEEMDCLSCGNCCRTLGPRILSKDVERLAKNLGVKEPVFIEKYLRVDEDGDWVFHSMPCPFLGADNYCAVYDARPKACREYPHTDRKRFYQLYYLSIKNAYTCPIVFEVLEKIRTEKAL